MTIPGHPHGGSSGGLSVHYVSSLNDVNPFTELGSPPGIVRVHVYVDSGVDIGSSSTGNAAMTLSGFSSGSTIFLRNSGSIVGAGGDGGLAGATGDTDQVGGGGGGGAGIIAGIGGAGHAAAPTQAGEDGTKTAGGLGKTPGVNFGSGVPINVSALNGQPGGDAITLGANDITIDNAGEIWGGGGGGGGGRGAGTPANNFGGDGGDPGKPGSNGGASPSVFPSTDTSGVGQAAGNAIRGTGTVTWISGGTTPNVEGDVGA